MTTVSELNYNWEKEPVEYFAQSSGVFLTFLEEGSNFCLFKALLWNATRNNEDNYE
jgi:hypothetical protein